MNMWELMKASTPLFRRGGVEGDHKAQSRKGAKKFPDNLHPSTSDARKASGRGPIRPARRLIIPSRAVVAEQSHLTAH